MNPISTGRATPALPAAPPENERLRGVARQMEGVFVEQLFKAMRETVPRDGVVDGGSGEEIFSGMLDQHLAQLVPGEWERGLSAAIYRQMRSALETARPETESKSGGTQ